MRAWRDGVEVDLGPPQQRALLCALVLSEGRPVQRGQLIEILWEGQEPPPSAVAMLRLYVSRLRAVLGHDRLVSLGGGYALSGVGTDLARFRDLVGADEHRKALALWNGEPLPDLPGGYGAARRAHLDEGRLAAVEAACARDIDRGRPDEAVAELTALVAQAPYRETVRALLMRALVACGRRAEALAVFDAVERLLDEDLGLAPGEDLRGLREQLLPTAVPEQLPAATADFTGREEQIQALIGALAEGRTVAVSALSGIGGVGKTTLAVQVAHLVREQYPDGQLHVDLHGTGTAPTDPSLALATLLRALGVADDGIPDKQADRAALWRSTLAGRRILLLLDNARDAQQVLPLLPGSPTCGVLVTSRAKLYDLVNVQGVDLGLLPPADSLTLLAKIIGADRSAAEPAQAVRLAELCGHLPLALRVAGSRLASRPAWSLESMADRLADEHNRLKALRSGSLAVDATFELSYRQLTPGQARAFRLTAVPDGPDLSLPTAAAILGLDAYEADDLLESLVDLSLLESATAGRYRHHDLLRAYARQQPDQEREQALERALGFSLSTALAGARVVNPKSPIEDHLTGSAVPGIPLKTSQDVYDWTRAELKGLLAVSRQAARTPGGRALRLAAELMYVAQMLMELLPYWQEVDPTLRALADGAVLSADPASEAFSRVQRGLLLSFRDELDQARAELERAVPVIHDQDMPFLRACALYQLANISRRQGHSSEAIGQSEQALTLFRELGDPYGESGALALQARILAAAGEHEPATRAAQRMVELGRALDDESNLAFALFQAGVVMVIAERPRPAIELLTEALTLHRAVLEPMWEALTLARLAAAHLAVEETEQAVEYAHLALELGRKLDLAFAMGLALTVLGEVEGNRDRLHEALALFLQSGDRTEAARVETLLKTTL
ncbi:BTAD domain-containing putative transcriptional regulator [Nonomuraea sp. NPDC050556]|uniref:AfsR/SARP family transcriptional regulator n=1 Tax=Nonomuraea sp. NPDC050556 TaxID=3364369 RepID=UPI0037923926